MEFTANGQKDDCSDIMIDGAVIDAKHYTFVSGSTIITLKNYSLETLALGEHEITIVYGNSVAKTNFTVKEASQKPTVTDDTKPGGNTGGDKASTTGSDKAKTDKKKTNATKTGDNTDISLLIGLEVATLIGLAVICYFRKRMDYSK